MRSFGQKKLALFKLLKNEAGISLATTLFFVAIVSIISASVAFTTASQLTNTETASDRTLAFNIAEAGLERLIGVYGQDFPTSFPQSETFIYNDEPLNGGSYTLSVVKDPDNVNGVKIKSVGTLDGHQRTIEVTLKGIPEVFNYAMASNAGELELENDGGEGSTYMLINGNVHSNGSIDLDGGKIYVNTPFYNEGAGSVPNPYYDPQWKVTSVGGINPNDPNFIGGYDPSDNAPINHPKIDYSYYKNQANFTDQQVFVGANRESYTVAQFNAEFAPTPPYTSSIVVINDRDLDITGSGVITATILTGSSSSDMGRLSIHAGSGGIDFMPVIGIAFTADRMELIGDINVGTEAQGAIIVVGEELDVDDGSGGGLTLWGTLLLGQKDDDEIEIEIEGNFIEINYTDSVHRNLQPGWSNWGSTLMYKDNWRES